jgi:predicted Fe-S protein YdhL (DUF1289 family)
MATTEEVKSPCVSVCAMDDLTGFCLGCYRTAEEIEGWWDMNADQQKAVVAAAAARQIEQADFD